MGIYSWFCCESTVDLLGWLALILVLLNVLISGATTNPPNYTLLNDKMAQFIDWYNMEAHNLHPVERAAKVHANFVGIHPFVVGNGRTSRLLMNLELMKAGYPPSVITLENRLAYYEALDQ